MTRFSRIARASLVVAIVCVVGCQTQTDQSSSSALPYYSEATFTPAWYKEGRVPSDQHSIPEFSVFDQTGRVVTEVDLEGRITIANFFFTDCAGICPMTMASLTRLSAQFANDPDVVLLSHSVMPETDSVAKLNEFADLVGAEVPKWYLVTGTPSEMYTLARTGYFADEDLGEGREAGDPSFLHSEAFYLLDGKRRIRGIYNGMSTAAVSQLAADVRTLLREEAPSGLE